MLHTITVLSSDTTAKKLDSLIQTVLSANVASANAEMNIDHRVSKQDVSIHANLDERISIIQCKSLCHK